MNKQNWNYAISSIILTVILFASSNYIFAEEPIEIINCSESTNYPIHNQGEYIPSEEEIAVTDIINNIEDVIKKEMLYEFWTEPAFGISGDTMNALEGNEKMNVNLVETYTHLANLSIF